MRSPVPDDPSPSELVPARETTRPLRFKGIALERPW